MEVFNISECKGISGMTCRISYNGKYPLPSQVFFREVDDNGKPLGKKIRLIYPKLNRGERGWATFPLRSKFVVKVVLTGEWNGPWRDPY